MKKIERTPWTEVGHVDRELNAHDTRRNLLSVGCGRLGFLAGRTSQSVQVNCYALEDEKGWTVVDPGLPGKEPWKALVDRFGRAGFAPRHIASGAVERTADKDGRPS